MVQNWSFVLVGFALVMTGFDFGTLGAGSIWGWLGQTRLSISNHSGLKHCYVLCLFCNGFLELLILEAL